MLETLLGSVVRERVLLYILARGEGYPREISRFFPVGLDPVQKQLTRLCEGGVLKRRAVGRTLLYSLDGSYRFIDGLTILLKAALAAVSEPWAEELREALVRREELESAGSRYTRREYRRGP